MKVARAKLQRRRARRGVLLLVILGLLAMFALVAVAFVMVAGHHMRSARAIQRIGQQEKRPRETLHLGFLQAVRGTPSPASVIGPHGLLEDIYGEPAYEGGITGVNSRLCGGQLFEFSITDPRPTRSLRFGGRVLTMLTGEAAGQSTYIVGVTSTFRCQALAFERGTPKDGDMCLINGAPFSGTGFGFDPASLTGLLDAKDPLTGLPRALLPNPLGFPNVGVPGGANEDNDAVDFQNMLLGAQIVDPTTGRVTTIPSLHRPALVNYWINQKEEFITWRDVPADLLRRIMLRPVGAPHPDADHPSFDGSNPNFNPAWDGVTPGGGSWDVDNDGEGRPDGIWVDLGMPVRAAPDGRLYKPLFSFLCVDLDGRLNLNAHGCYAQTQTGSSVDDYYNYYDVVQAGSYYRNGKTDPSGRVPYRFAGATSSRARLPRGQGYGPAEINLGPLFLVQTTDDLGNPLIRLSAAYRQLFVGSATLGLDGRYGETGVAAMPGPGRSAPIPDPLSYNKHFDYPADYSKFRQLTSYGTLPDLKGTLAVGLDVRGQPLYPSPIPPDWVDREPTVLLRDPTVPSTEGNPYTMASVNHPYELDLSRNRGRGLPGPAPIDNPFSVTEWERLVRPFDRDAGRLPKRLLALTYDAELNQSMLHAWRHVVTTESWDLPCPNILRHTQTGVQKVRHVGDLLGGPNPRVWPQLLAPEVLAGQRMDLNRPFGNGRDGNGNGVVDEPGEDVPPTTMKLYVQGPPSVPQDVPVSVLANPMDLLSSDVDLDGSITVKDFKNARELYARHLYVLAMAVVDGSYWGDNDEKKARELAQWAVNVVDFRDRDSIMTRFRYDPNPSGGWNPTRIVWGCERPELLITETLAFHDRRTEDTDNEQHDPTEEGDNSTEAGKTVNGGETDQKKQDASFDQKVRPQGSLFVEVYNPWTSMEPLHGEFCYDRTKPNQPMIGVRLNQTTFQGNHPVWRLIIVETEKAPENGEQPDPDDPVDANRPQIERSVYFVDLSTSKFDDPNDGRSYYTDTNISQKFAPVMPGRYAVIGPGDPTAAGPEYATAIGERFDRKDPNNPVARSLADTRRIELTPNPDPNTIQVKVLLNRNTFNYVQNTKPPVALVINKSTALRPTRLSISEPITGYPQYEDPDQYNPIRDVPLDPDANLPNDVKGALATNGTTPAVQIVHLQRLANPLLPWDAITNPFLTIDSMPVDLTTFNGRERESLTDPKVAQGTVMLHTRERGGEDSTSRPNEVNNLWKQEPIARKVAEDTRKVMGSGQYNFSRMLKHTLGFLNHGFGSDQVGGRLADTSGTYTGDPGKGPFPWLTWNNRPFVSQFELLLVPALRSSKLLVRNEKDPYKYFRFVKAGVTPKPYAPTAAQDVPYPHLANFFASTKSDGSGKKYAELHRLLEYVHVPSRFVGTELQGSPAAFAAAGNHAFHPPFNRISLYREPGRININTVFSGDVWKGLMNFFPHMDLKATAGWKWGKFQQTRQGYAAGNPLEINPKYPTRFAGVFRSSAGGGMVPLESLKPTREVNATLLRQENARVAGENPPDAGPPLFNYDHLATGRAASAYPDDANRNPYFRYQGLRRLGNLVTTRSNVYAIWITVGYFEVEPVPSATFKRYKPDKTTEWDPAEYRRVYPDGYALGAELGSETGEVKRHRAFYVFDRSIPVGFRRGRDYNVEEAVLVKRFIE